MKKWSPIILLALAQFIMVLDSTVMNVSISTVVKDLDTSVAAMQAAITFFTLTMAAFMLTGGKLGDILGRRKTFLIGLTIYGCGAFITSISPNIQTLIFGWSLLEGLGAALVIPASAALIASRYVGRDRVTAFAIMGAVAGIAVAVGPLIGGFITTYLSWRMIFAFEAVVVIGILILHKIVPQSDKIKGASLDIPSVILSAGGMAVLIYGILQSKTWGWITPTTIPEIGGYKIAPLGVSLVTYLIFVGILLLIWFFIRQRALISRNISPLLDIEILKIPQLRGGLAVLTSQYLIVGAMFFVAPIYLQMVIGLDPLSTGLKILPLSVSLIIFSILGSRFSQKFSPKTLVRMGQLLLVFGVTVIAFTIDPKLESIPLTLGMLFLGAGLGILASQIGNINMNAVDKNHSGEVGGLQGTAQNIGSSLGTAVIGSVLIISLSSGFSAEIASDTQIPSNIRQQIEQQASKGIPVLSTQEINDLANKSGYSEQDSADIVDAYSEAQVAGLRKSMVFLVFISILSIFLSRKLPSFNSFSKTSKAKQ